MTDSNQSKRAWATIDLVALKKNLALVRSNCPESKIIPVIKANAYGHGMEQVARAIKDSHTKIAAFAVATMSEARALHKLDLAVPILLLPGFFDLQELDECIEKSIEPVVHSDYQLELLEQKYEKEFHVGLSRLWLKLNSGMNRLGLKREKCIEAFYKLHKFPETDVVLMSHFAFADNMNDPNSLEFTQQQLKEFNALRDEISEHSDAELECTLAASAGILTLPDSYYDYVRPGVMLYGASPLEKESGEDMNLLPVMSLHSRIIAINNMKAGDTIGYNAIYTCERDMRIGVVSMGYADGYPRSAVSGTPLIVKSESGSRRTQLVGRVSMDLMTIDLTGMDDVQLGDEVVLWGETLCADDVAKMAGTISYELFCKVTGRVPFEYKDSSN